MQIELKQPFNQMCSHIVRTVKPWGKTKNIKTQFQLIQWSQSYRQTNSLCKWIWYILVFITPSKELLSQGRKLSLSEPRLWVPSVLMHLTVWGEQSEKKRRYFAQYSDTCPMLRWKNKPLLERTHGQCGAKCQLLHLMSCKAWADT